MEESKPVPAELLEWAPLEFYQKKVQIYKCTDTAFLDQLIRLDDDADVKELARIRLQEINEKK